MTARIRVDELSHTSSPVKVRRAPGRALRCLVCDRPVVTRDHGTVERRKGRGWTRTEVRIVTDCSRCGVRTRTRVVHEFDDGVARKGYVP